MRKQGVKEVKEAVLIAALTALATGLINIALDEFKRRREEKK